MSKKIIAISATHGCGKTTIVYSLAAHLKKLGRNVVVLNELARECPFEINQEGEDRTQIWLISKHITRELELMDRYDYIITDRSLFDAYAYASYLTNGTWIFEHLYEYIKQHIFKYYKKIYLLDPNKFNYNIEDGVRDNDVVFRQDVHDILSSILLHSGAPYKQVYTEEDIYVDFKN